MYNVVFFLILAFLLFDFVFQTTLEKLNASWFAKPLPKVLQGIYDENKYATQQRYSYDKYRFGIINSLVSFLALSAFFCLGLFGWLDTALRQFLDSEIPLALVFFGILLLLNEILSLPFEYYATFTIEEKYGFNKSTKGLFFADNIKSLLLTMLIGGALLALVIWLYELAPEWFWLSAWAVVALFSIFLQMFYSQLIVPLFNKQTPLLDGELRSAIEQFAARAGFELKNIYVIDSSKRSTKANAYFSGLGAKKRIVLYDTLIEQLTTDEIVAVLAHEIGHYKKKHTLSHLAVSLASNLLMFFLLGLCLSSQVLSDAMGAGQPSFHIGMLAFVMLYAPVSLLLGLGMNAFSRKHEFEADAYAKSFGMADSLISGLKKLSASSLSNLQPHPAYVFVHFSHPTLLQRINALSR